MPIVASFHSMKVRTSLHRTHDSAPRALSVAVAAALVLRVRSRVCASHCARRRTAPLSTTTAAGSSTGIRRFTRTHVGQYVRVLYSVAPSWIPRKFRTAYMSAQEKKKSENQSITKAHGKFAMQTAAHHVRVWLLVSIGLPHTTHKTIQHSTAHTHTHTLTHTPRMWLASTSVRRNLDAGHKGHEDGKWEETTRSSREGETEQANKNESKDETHFWSLAALDSWLRHEYLEGK